MSNIPSQPPARTRAVWDKLIQVAHVGSTISYDELGTAVGLPRFALARQLNYIHYAICEKRDLPWITSIVVGVSGLPSQEAWAATWDFTGQQIPFIQMWRWALQAVHGYPGWLDLTVPELDETAAEARSVTAVL